MGNDLKIIRTEIMRILNENGKTRSNELVKRVIKKVGNEKMVYREISSLVESGEIEKKVISKSHIEYELINLSQTVNEQLRKLHKELSLTLDELTKYHEEISQIKSDYDQRLRTIIDFIHALQSIEGIMRLLSYYPAFKKDKMYSQISRKINDYWESVMEFITHQPEEEFLNRVLANMRINQINLNNFN